MSKYRLLINIDLLINDGDALEEAVLEKRRIMKLMQSLKATTPSIADIQCDLRERRGEKTPDIRTMKFLRN